MGTYRCCEISTTQHGCEENDKIQKLLSCHPARLDTCGLLEPLILGNDTDEELDERKQGDKVEDGRDACMVGQIKAGTLVATIANLTNASSIVALPSAGTQLFVRGDFVNVR